MNKHIIPNLIPHSHDYHLSPPASLPPSSSRSLPETRRELFPRGPRGVSSRSPLCILPPPRRTAAPTPRRCPLGGDGRSQRFPRRSLDFVRPLDPLNMVIIKQLVGGLVAILYFPINIGFIIIPIDWYFSEGFKPPTRQWLMEDAESEW